jgi:RNA recognition motif-containing protein
VTTICVENLIAFTEEQDLKILFGQFGSVWDVNIFRDRRTDESLEYAFVQMEDEQEAERAIRRLNGRSWNARRLKIGERRPPRHREQH